MALEIPQLQPLFTVLAILLLACLHFEGKAFGVRKAAAKWFPNVNLLTARLNACLP